MNRGGGAVCTVCVVSQVSEVALGGRQSGLLLEIFKSRCICACSRYIKRYLAVCAEKTRLSVWKFHLQGNGDVSMLVRFQ